jgi:hypothetical protein
MPPNEIWEKILTFKVEMKKVHLTREQRYTISCLYKQGCSQKKDFTDNREKQIGREPGVETQRQSERVFPFRISAGYDGTAKRTHEKTAKNDAKIKEENHFPDKRRFFAATNRRQIKT